MAMKLVNGNYVPNERGGQEQISGTEAVMQRVLMKLKARRGGFALMPEFGSKLYLLSREKPSARQRAAEQYISEALADETEVNIVDVQVGEDDDGICIGITVNVGDSTASVSMKV